MCYELLVKMAATVSKVPESLEKKAREICERAGHSLVSEIRTLFATQGGLKKAHVTFAKLRYDGEQVIGGLAAKLAHKGIKPEQLDDTVHDVASQAASTVNNQGLEGQIRFLLVEVGLEETQQIVHNTLTGETRDDAKQPDQSSPP